MIILKALLLGIVEGLTEFLPISSTGHLILVSRYIEYPEALRASFEIFIQLGAILAVVWHFRRDLGKLVVGSWHEPESRGLVWRIALAFLPSAVVGLLLGHAIQARLFTPTVVACSLALGGVVMIAIERIDWSRRGQSIQELPWSTAAAVGLAQTLSLVPGVSRSAATIMGGMVAGASRPVATIFSFYLSIPTMFAASSYSLLKARHLISIADIAPLAVGFVAAFVSALFVVRGLLSYVQRHDFTPFGIYRIVLGILVLLTQ